MSTTKQIESKLAELQEHGDVFLSSNIVGQLALLEDFGFTPLRDHDGYWTDGFSYYALDNASGHVAFVAGNDAAFRDYLAH